MSHLRSSSLQLRVRPSVTAGVHIIRERLGRASSKTLLGGPQVETIFIILNTICLFYSDSLTFYWEVFLRLHKVRYGNRQPSCLKSDIEGIRKFVK